MTWSLPQPVRAVAVAWVLVFSPLAAFPQTSADDLIALNDRGLQQLLAGDVDEAERTFKRVVELAAGGKSDLALARALNNLGSVQLSRGQSAETITLCEQSARVFLKLDDDRGIAEAEGNLATAHFALGQRSDAFLYASHVTELYATLGRQAGPAEAEYFLDRLIIKIQFLVNVLREMREPDLAREYIARARPIAAALGETAIARLDLAEASLDEWRRPWRALPAAWRLEQFFAERRLGRDANEANAVLNASIRPMLFWISFVLSILYVLLELIVRPQRIMSTVVAAWRFIGRPIAALGRWILHAVRHTVIGHACVLLAYAFLAAEYVFVTAPTLRAVDAASTMLSEWPLPGNLRFLLTEMLASLPPYLWLGFVLTVLFFAIWLPVSIGFTRALSSKIESMLSHLTGRVLNRRRAVALPVRVEQALAAQRGDSLRHIWITARVVTLVTLLLLSAGIWTLPSSALLSASGLLVLVVVECWLAVRDYLLIRRLQQIKPHQVYERLYPPGLVRGPAVFAALAVFAWAFVPLCASGLLFLQTEFIYRPFHERATELAADLFTGVRVYHTVNLPGDATLVFAKVSQTFEPAKGAEAVETVIRPFLPALGVAAMIMWFFALVVPFLLSLVLKDPRLFWKKVWAWAVVYVMGLLVTYLLEPVFAIHTAPWTLGVVWTVLLGTIMWSVEAHVSD